MHNARAPSRRNLFHDTLSSVTDLLVACNGQPWGRHNRFTVCRGGSPAIESGSVGEVQGEGGRGREREA